MGSRFWLCFVVFYFQFHAHGSDRLGIVPPPLSPPGTYTSYILGPVCRPNGPIRNPQNVQQILELVKMAKQSGLKIKAIGHRHSMTDIICTEGIAIDMSLIKGIRMNSDSTVTVAAGVTLRELGEFLRWNNRALKITPAFGEITIGGSLGSGSHGSSLKHVSTLSDQTVSVTIIDGTGTIKKITSEEDMRGFRVHLGMLGIILDATLRTVPDFKLRVHNYETSDDILTNGLWKDMAMTSDSFFIYWFPTRRTVVVSNGTYVPVSVPGNAFSNDHVPPTTQFFNTLTYPIAQGFQAMDSFTGLNLMEKYMQKTLTEQVPLFAPIYTEDGRTLENPAIGYAYKMMAGSCNDECTWDHYPFNLSLIDNEMSFNLKHLSSFVRTVRHILSITPATFPLQGILLRFSKGSDSYMSTSYGRDSVHFEWYAGKRIDEYETPISGMTAYQLMMQSLAFNYNGRSHWGKSGLFYHSRKILQSKIGKKNYEAFVFLMRKYDPYGIFINNFGKRLLNKSNKIDIDPATKHCAIQDNCICKTHTDCSMYQFCGVFSEYPRFNVCRNTKDLLS